MDLLGNFDYDAYDSYNISVWNETYHFYPDASNKSWNSTGQVELYYVPVGLIVLLAFLYGSISLFAVIGNGIVIYVIMANKKMQTVTNIFIANLALADVIIGLFSIPFQFQAALLQRWVLPYFMCKLAPFVTNVSVNVSVFTLTVIAIDRYIAVIYPLKAGFKKRVAAVVLAVIWLVGISSSLPMAVHFRVGLNFTPKGDKILFCNPKWPSKIFGRYYYMYLLVVQYLIPLIIINFSYFRIAFKIWGTKAPGQDIDRRDNVRTRNKKKVVKMLIIVVCLFVLCWMPLQVYQVLSELYVEVNKYKYINIIWFCSNWLAMSNSCYNPFIYGLLNEKFKREFRLLFRVCACRRSEKESELGEYSDDSAINRGSTVMLNGRETLQLNGKVYKSRRNTRPTHTNETEQSII
ncbi:Neuropeptide Y receptor [Mizuhopecten yessoensis]|uniref:Neuropeptide Y receptor n=1 Tax=Mizuhopecten yessoensis TaxID=6573 RepID=A0A210QS90_MIZYE|nr:Neuropeptide Y receptor [Mizuhopecten yessoensis]